MKSVQTISYKIYQLVINGFIYDRYATFLYLISFFKPTKPLEVVEFPDTELLEMISSGKSLIRFGDGEAMLMTGRDIHYQKTSRTLSNSLRLIVDSYSDDSPYIIGIPAYALRKEEEELKKENRLRIWRLFRVFFKLRFPNNLKYYCLVYFYRKGNFENKVAPLLKDRNVICVANPKVLDTTLQSYLATYFKTADFVFSPPQDAYSEKNNLMNEINNHLNKYQTDNCTILLATGPASKVIAHEYALRGIQAIDVGHGMEIIGRGADYTDRI